jgi:hypothetical protein
MPFVWFCPSGTIATREIIPMARYRLHRSAAAKRGQFNRPDTDDVRDADTHAHPGAAGAHHLMLGLVVGHASGGRLDRRPREQAHRGRTYEDSAVAKLEPHDLDGNRRPTEERSRASVGNIASRKGGREEWSQYAHERSDTRDKQNAAISGRGARGRHCTGYPANA